MLNLTDKFYETVAKQPNRPAIIGPKDGQTLSYKELQEKIEILAEALKSVGVEKGSCVGVHYPSGIDYIVLTYALWRCGACSVPIAVELTPDEKQEICQEIGMSGVLSARSSLTLFEIFRNGEVKDVSGTTFYIPFEQKVIHPDGFKTINPAFLRFTSGTTSSAKGVVLSHETIFDRIHAANDGLHLTPDDKVVWLLSMSYHFAVSIVSYLYFGSAIILCKNHFGQTIVKITNEQQGTLMYGSPVHYELMAHDKSELMLDSLRLIVATTTALQPKTAEVFYQRFNKPLNETYGIIEVGLPCMNIDKPVEFQGSVGRPLPSYDICLEDIGLGEQQKAIKIKSKGIFDAYYNPWKPREKVLENGYFASGDLGYFNNEGYLFITGRSSEIINAGGMKFFPQEVESVLEQHEAVKEACVFTRKNPRFGEVPFARVVLQEKTEIKTLEKELRNFCLQRLVNYKVPEAIYVVDELTRTASGKIIRDESRF